MLVNYLVPYSEFGHRPRHRLRTGYPVFSLNIENLFEHTMGRFEPPVLAAKKDSVALLKPCIDVCEAEKHYTVTAELPGIDEKELKVEFNDGYLTIEGEKKAEHADDSDDFHVVERSFGTFKRAFKVPNDVNVDGIDAAFKNSVLTVVLRKKEEATKMVKNISVKAH